MFIDSSSAAPLYQFLHPTQILESFLAFLAFLIFWFKFKTPPRLPGAAFVWALMVYSVIRFVVEFFRGDFDRGIYFGGLISTSQLIAVGTVFGCCFWFWVFRRHR